MAAAALLPDRVPQLAVVHAFGAGAMGTMMLAMMTRATLGHTGRALSADRATVAVYLLVASSAVLRLVAALVPGFYAVAIELAGEIGRAHVCTPDPHANLVCRLLLD